MKTRTRRALYAMVAFASLSANACASSGAQVHSPSVGNTDVQSGTLPIDPKFDANDCVSDDAGKAEPILDMTSARLSNKSILRGQFARREHALLDNRWTLELQADGCAHYNITLRIAGPNAAALADASSAKALADIVSSIPQRKQLLVDVLVHLLQQPEAGCDPGIVDDNQPASRILSCDDVTASVKRDGEAIVLEFSQAL